MLMRTGTLTRFSRNCLFKAGVPDFPRLFAVYMDSENGRDAA
jgi:hypothetical protein